MLSPGLLALPDERVDPHGSDPRASPAPRAIVADPVSPDKLGLPMHRRLALSLACSRQRRAGSRSSAPPQYRVPPLSDLSGAPGLSLALRKLNTVGTLMHATAHPDDENNAMLALYARSLGCGWRWCRRRAATAGRTRSAPSCSTRSASCAPKSCWRPTSSTARSSTSRARWISATRSARRKPREVGRGRRFSAISSGTSGRCGPTSWSRWAPKGPAAASTTRRPQ